MVKGPAVKRRKPFDPARKLAKAFGKGPARKSAASQTAQFEQRQQTSLNPLFKLKGPPSYAMYDDPVDSIVMGSAPKFAQGGPKVVQRNLLEDPSPPAPAERVKKRWIDTEGYVPLSNLTWVQCLNVIGSGDNYWNRRGNLVTLLSVHFRWGLTICTASAFSPSTAGQTSSLQSTTASTVANNGSDLGRVVLVYDMKPTWYVPTSGQPQAVLPTFHDIFDTSEQGTGSGSVLCFRNPQNSERFKILRDWNLALPGFLGSSSGPRLIDHVTPWDGHHLTLLDEYYNDLSALSVQSAFDSTLAAVPKSGAIFLVTSTEENQAPAWALRFSSRVTFTSDEMVRDPRFGAFGGPQRGGPMASPFSGGGAGPMTVGRGMQRGMDEVFRGGSRGERVAFAKIGAPGGSAGSAGGKADRVKKGEQGWGRWLANKALGAGKFAFDSAFGKEVSGAKKLAGELARDALRGGTEQALGLFGGVGNDWWRHLVNLGSGQGRSMLAAILKRLGLNALKSAGGLGLNLLKSAGRWGLKGAATAAGTLLGGPAGGSLGSMLANYVVG